MPKIAPIESAPLQAERTSRFRWVMIGFAFFATTINYLDRQVLSVVAASADFKAAIPISEEAYGYIASAFMLAYTIMNGLSGPFIDHVGTRLGYACCMVWWSLAGILHVFARGPLSLGCFRFLLGAGEAGNWPAAAKLVGEWFPPKERALASGIFNSGASIGAVISTPIIAWIVLQMGWRSAFVIMGLLGMVWLAFWMLYGRTPEAKDGKTQSRIPARQLLSTRFVIFFTLSKVFMDPVWYFFVFWFPKYLAEVHHFSLKEIGWKGWIPYFTAAVGNLAGGLLTSLLIQCQIEVPKARKISVTFFGLCMLSSIPAILSRDPATAIALISLTTFGYTGYTSNTLAFPAEVFPTRAVASVWGLASMGSGIGGMLFMALSGRAIAHFGYVPVFIGYGILPLLALIGIFLAGPLRKHPRFDFD